MIYLHVPFCKSFCAYCDFYSEVCPANESERAQKLFADRMCREIDGRRDEIEASRGLRTLYIGGGTPSVLNIGELQRIVRHLDAGPYEEFTIEVNPEDIVLRGPAYVEALLELGVSRISMGVQSMDDGVLRWMRRRHDSARATEAVRILREAGVRNLSLDLIFGLSQLSPAHWRSTLDQVLALCPEHLSAYQLSIEPGSALAEMVRQGTYVEAPDEQCRGQYEALCERMEAAGFRHYEISNFALPGREAVHNSAYWRRLPYVGLGPGAHSFDGKRQRSWNSEALSGWQRSTETLTDEAVRLETLMLGLRTAEGLPAAWLRAHSETRPLQALLAEGSLCQVQDRIRIPEDHFFVSDDIIRTLS
ncbi:MAG: radical SAM family heme chaperone HemW [Bacteroidales bacterium]|nr:radical SAM family heme chaperone HemW [Bacteroidales bacterium]